MWRGWTVLRHDGVRVRRDSVLLNLLGMTLAMLTTVLALRVTEAFREWWLPIQLVVLVGSMPGFGYLAGMLMIDEFDAGVDRALAVTPLSPWTTVALRASAAWLAATVFALVMILGGRLVILTPEQWWGPLMILTLTTPWIAILVPALASNKVRALGLFKGLNLFVAVGLVDLFLPRSAWYANLTLLTPSTWAIRALQASAEGVPSWGWACGGLLYSTGLLLAAALLFRRARLSSGAMATV